MRAKHDDAKGTAKVFQIVLHEHSDPLQGRLIRNLFTDHCSKCKLPSFVEVESPPEIDLPPLKQEIGLACGFWLARKEIARLICAEFEGQLEMKKISDNACFLIFKNVLIPDDPFYKSDIGHDPSLFSETKSEFAVCAASHMFLCIRVL